MAEEQRPVANSLLVLREEFDDWAVLFDPDTGDAFGMNPVGVMIWKMLDGAHTRDEILAAIQEQCENVPEEAPAHLDEFISDLVERGFAGYEVAQA